ncbi:hypothetical protein MRB53_015141 [Persea americana]|uniref:Uncharacterized protein n=1 Tax=Persea americana TaxID=3435 RepID=A0ACC2KDC8_PERAE|nr:hypothetical protein MRB53_015141 [Persea americana]
MRQRTSSAQVGATAEFKTGCKVFLDYAYSHPECVNGQNKIRCPCLKCKNVNYMDRDMVAYHLLVKGFMNNYEDCWWAHGQRRDSGITQVDHQFRRNRENFRKGKGENDMPAPRLSGTEMLDRVMRLLVIQFGKIAASKIINGFGNFHNWVQRSIFWELPYQSTNLIRHILDVMHIEKNVFDNAFNTLMGFPGKTKDSDKARLDMKDICKRPGLELYETPNGGKLQGMKSHDCHVFMERLMPLAFRDLLDKPIWDALTDLSCFFRDIYSKMLNEKDMSILEKNIIEITYYFPDEVLTKANRVPRHDYGGNVELNGRLSVFGLPGCAYGKGKHIFLFEQELHAAHTCILFNCEEINDFVRSYDDELKANQSGITDKDIQLSRDQNFALWLKDKALNDVSIPSNVQVLAMGPDRDQVCRNGYKVNGYDFHTRTYACGKRTTNTGVCVQGDCYNELEKGIRVDRHGIADIDVHRSTYVNAPFVLPTQTLQVYYTPSPIKKRDRPPADWQVVIHTPVCTRVQLVDGEFYQEEMLHRPPVINVDDNNELNQLVGGDEPDELDPKSVPVPVDSDTEEEELLTETDTDTESEEDDGYESPHDVHDDSESDNDFH